MNAQARLEARIKLAECDVTVTRVFDAPRDLVFRMWTDPAHLMRWWGPRGYTNPVCELDARIGGSIFVRMRAPSGRVVLMNGAFREIVRGRAPRFQCSRRDARRRRRCSRGSSPRRSRTRTAGPG